MKPKKLKLIITASIVGLLFVSIGSGFFLYKSFNNKDEKSQSQIEEEQKIDDAVKNSEVLSDDEKESMSQDEKEQYAKGEDYNNKAPLINEKSNLPEISEDKAKALYKKLCDLSLKADYQGIIDEINKQKKDYKFTEKYDNNICQVYVDANVLQQTLTVNDYKQKAYMVKNVKDPVLFMTGGLFMPEKSRRDILLNTTSLSPVFKGTIQLNDTEIITEPSDKDSIAKTLFDYGSVHCVYKFNICIENNPLFAYVIKYDNGSCAYATIVKNGDYNCNYKDVDFWISMDSKLY